MATVEAKADLLGKKPRKSTVRDHVNGSRRKMQFPGCFVECVAITQRGMQRANMRRVDDVRRTQPFQLRSDPGIVGRWSSSRVLIGRELLNHRQLDDDPTTSPPHV